MIDRYTKAVLTVIAAALTVLCVQNWTSEATAQGSDCGGISRPCAVTNERNLTFGGSQPLLVEVVNLR